MNAPERIRALTAELASLDARIDAAARSTQRSYRATPRAMRQVDQWIKEASACSAERGRVQGQHFSRTGEWLGNDGAVEPDEADVCGCCGVETTDRYCTDCLALSRAEDAAIARAEGSMP